MKVKVLQRFRDKNDPTKFYNAGEEIDVDSKRAKKLEKLGLANVLRTAHLAEACSPDDAEG